MWELLDQGLGSKLAQIVSERAHLILVDGIAERLHDVWEQFGRGENASSGDVTEANQRVHQCELSGMVGLQAWDPFPIVEHGRLTEPFHLTPARALKCPGENESAMCCSISGSAHLLNALSDF
jgi:hypothetical protein